MVFFKAKYWSIVVMLLVWPLAELNAQTSGDQTSGDVITVRPIGSVNGFMTETLAWKVLELALEKSGRAYDLAPSTHSRLIRREDRQMRRLGDDGNLIWASPIYAPNTELIPIKIPILRGLASYRYLWVRAADVKKFSHIQTADDLKDFSVLTGQSWGANYILESEGFDLRPGASANLPRMLMAGRGEVLLWPVTGIFNMLEKFGAKNMDMIPVPTVVVRLPQVVYFWVAPEGTQDHHEAITLGLKTAIADGSHDQLIRSFPYIGDAYADLTANDFLVIDIENPDLNDEVLSELDIYGLKVGEKR